MWNYLHEERESEGIKLLNCREVTKEVKKEA